MSLERLDLCYNEISGLPLSFGNLQLLKYLNMSKNELQSLNYELSSLKLLENLDISYNNLSELDGIVSVLENLKILDLSNNNSLNKIHHEAYLAPNLKMMNLKNTALSDSQVRDLMWSKPSLLVVQ